MSVSPEYAVFISGSWGSGKTWFIKNYLEKNVKKKFIYVSLNGVSTFQEIEDSFLQQLHPVLSKKGMKLAGKILNGAIKTAINIDLNIGKDMGIAFSPMTSDLQIPAFLKNIDKRILIFDDLERCSIPLADIMGYINLFIEDKGQKVIILGNEEQINKDDEKRKTIESKCFKSIKEKVVGQSFRITPEYNDALESFTNEISNGQCQAFIKTNIRVIMDSFKKAGYNNLRHLRISLFDFERFFKLLPKEFEYEGEIAHVIISIFFSLSFEIKKGQIFAEDVSSVMSFDRILTASTAPPDKITNVINKYGNHFGYGNVFSGKSLQEFFVFGTTDKKNLKNEIQSCSFFIRENSPTWAKLADYRNLEDDEFQKLSAKLILELKGNVYTDKYEIVQSVSLLTSFSKLGLIKKSIPKIIQFGKDSLKNIVKSGSFTIQKNENFPNDYSNGLMYSEMDIPEFKDFLKFCIELGNNEKANRLKSKSISLINLMETSIFDFEEALTSYSIPEGYFDIPILQFVDPNSFVNIVIKLKNPEKRRLVGMFNSRYNVDQFAEKLIPEILFLKNVYALLEGQIAGDKVSISYLTVKQGILPSISQAIDRIEKLEKKVL